LVTAVAGSGGDAAFVGIGLPKIKNDAVRHGEKRMSLGEPRPEGSAA
jgi:hypothetical protein